MTVLSWCSVPELKDAANVETIEVSILVGMNEGELQCVGVLRLGVGDWQIIGAALMLGAERTKGHLVIVDPARKAD